MHSMLKILAPLVSAAVLTSCYGAKSLDQNSSSRISTITVGNFKTTGDMKSWESGRIIFKKTADKSTVVDEAFFSSKDSTDSKIDLKVPKGMYTVTLVYFAASDKQKPLYKNCLDDKNQDVVYALQKDAESLKIEICDGDGKIIGETAGSDGSDVSVTPEVKKSSSQPAMTNNLVGSWTLCDQIKDPTAPLLSQLTTLTFESDTKGKSLIIGYKDADCKTLITQADVDAYLAAHATETGDYKQYLQDTVKGIAVSFKYELGKPDANGIATFDLLTDDFNVAPLYTNLKIMDKQLFFGLECTTEDVADKTCPAVTGNRPDNRGNEFEKLPFIKK